MPTLLLTLALAQVFGNANDPNAPKNAPIIFTVSPSTAGVGATVTIVGENFGDTQGTSTVTFNGMVATVSAWAKKSLTLTVPSLAITGPVVVTVGGVASNSVTFTLSTSALCSTTTADAARATVQAAIDAAAAGDTVCVPTGTASWTPVVTISGKPLTLQGAGAGNTVITMATANQLGLDVTASTTNVVRVTGFTFKASANITGDALVRIGGPIGDVAAFRFDNNVLDDDNQGSSSDLLMVQSVFGSVDHNVFWRRAGGQPFAVKGSPDGTDLGYTPWTRPLNKGSAEAVTMEDNLFHKYVSIETGDQYGGSRFAFRFNTLDGECIGGHGFDSGNRRSELWQEVLGNKFYVDTAGGNPLSGTICGSKADQIRGGSQISWGNTYDAHYATTYEVYYARATNSYAVDPGMAGWLYCDGTKYDLDANLTHSTTFGTVNRFRSTDDETVCGGAVTGTCTIPVDTGANTGSVAPYGYPCRDQAGRTPGQTLTPLYQVNNNGRSYFASYNGCGGQGVTNGTCSPLVAGGLSVSTWISADREFYNAASGVQTNATNPFNGTTGAGWGTLANRPTTCTTGVGYLATDQGSWNTSSSNPFGVNQNGASGVFFTCTATNTWSTYYTPYVYPNPMQGVYRTGIPTTENPISEGGVWINGKATGGSWSNVQSTAHLLFGTQTGSNGFDDSIAVLSGTWQPTQTVSARVHKTNQVPTSDTTQEEVEVLLRASITAGNYTGYECNYAATNSSLKYMQVVRLNGALGAFTLLSSTGGPGINDGDIVSCAISGATITSSVNGTVYITVTDSTYTSGRPGVGFYRAGSFGTNSDYGFTNYTAVSR